MNKETAQKLKDAGFPQELKDEVSNNLYYKGNEKVIGAYAENVLEGNMIKIPSLSELIGACNPSKSDELYISTHMDGWRALYRYYGFFEHNEKFKKEDGMYEVDPETFGKTPEEAVANLWLALNSKS